MKNITDEEIEKLLLNSQWRKVIEYLIDIVRSNEATFHDYAAFIDAVSSGEFEDCYEIAFNCFIKANSSSEANPVMLRILYLRIDPIIKTLGFRYFDDENSNNIPKDFYLRARFMLYIAASKFNDAIAAITELIDYSKRPAYYFQRSKIYGIQKKYKLALNDLNSAIELAPSDSMLYYHRALLKQKIHDIQGAIFDFDTAINYNSQNYQYYFARGMLHENFEHYKNALDDFKKTVQLNPNNVKAFQEIAWCKYKMKKPEEGFSFVNIALQLDEKNAGSYYIRGCILNALLRYDEAVFDFETAISYDNQSNKMWTSKLWHQKAWSEFRLEKFQEAQNDINQAIKLNPRNLSYYFLAMDIEFFGIKDYYAAKGYAKTILKLDNQNQRAIAAMMEINEKIAF